MSLKVSALNYLDHEIDLLNRRFQLKEIQESSEKRKLIQKSLERAYKERENLQNSSVYHIKAKINDAGTGRGLFFLVFDEHGSPAFATADDLVPADGSKNVVVTNAVFNYKAPNYYLTPRTGVDWDIMNYTAAEVGQAERALGRKISLTSRAKHCLDRFRIPVIQ